MFIHKLLFDLTSFQNGLISDPLLQVCVPLILQNKLALAESFVTGHSHLEKQLVTLLDSWCHPNFSVEEIRKYGVSVLISLRVIVTDTNNCVIT